MKIKRSTADKYFSDAVRMAADFACDKCGTHIIDSDNGYITGCVHYPMAKVDIPSLGILEEYLRNGYYIEIQDNEVILFRADGDGFVSGDTLRAMLVNLIFSDGSDT